MSGSAAAVYVIDSSSLMDWYARYYPADVFPGLLERMEALVASGRLLAPDLVREEIEAVGPAALRDWVAARRGLIVPKAELLVGALAIESQFAGLRDPKAQYEEADAYVIALAHQRGGMVVTQETPASEKRNPKRTHYIPDVCRDLGIGCVALLGLIRREKWSF